MPPTPVPPDDLLDRTDPLTPGARLGWWGGYVFLVLLAFCFGVWAGTQRPKPVESAAAPAAPPADKAPEPAPESKKELTPEPKKAPEAKQSEPKTAPEVVTPEPKKAPEPVTPEPKKAPEVKKVPESMVKDVLFAKEVLPIFKAKCNSCHGDTKGVKADLDLRTLASIAKGGEGGPAVKAGDLKTGTIWAVIEDNSMPPAGSGKEPLTDAEKAVIRNWILSGAK